MTHSIEPTPPLSGTPDGTFDPAPALRAMAGFELHGLALSSCASTLYLALSQGNQYALGALAGDASASPGFGKGGFVVDSFDATAGSGVKPGRRVLQFGSRMIVGGMVEHAPGHCSPALACHRSDGQRDPSFNGSGQLILANAVASSRCAMGPISFASNLGLCTGDGGADVLLNATKNQDFNQVNFDMAVANERIYVIATGRIGQQNRLSGFLFCVKADGSLDERFGDRGITALSSPDYSILLRSIVIDEQAIYVAGGASGGHNPALVAKVDFTGQQDRHWGDATCAGYGMTAQSFRINDLAIDPQGALFGVGVGSKTRAIAVRFGADGRQDMSFAGKGAYMPGLAYSAFTYAQADALGRLLFIGEYIDESHGFLQAVCGRLTAVGQPDTSFGPQGLAKLPMVDSIGVNLVVQPNQQIIAAGYTKRHRNPFACRLHG